VEFTVGAGRTPAPEGNHTGLLVAIYDIGTQPSAMYAPSRKLVAAIRAFDQVSGAPMLGHDGGPMIVTREFGASFGPKSLWRQFAEGVLGRRFKDGETLKATDLFRRPFAFRIDHETKAKGGQTYTNEVVGFFVPSQDQRPLAHPGPEPFVFTITGRGCYIPSEVPDWIRKKIERSPEHSGVALAPQQAAGQPQSFPPAQGFAPQPQGYPSPQPSHQPPQPPPLHPMHPTHPNAGPLTPPWQQPAQPAAPPVPPVFANLPPAGSGPAAAPGAFDEFPSF
jgi:hypothetical protein